MSLAVVTSRYLDGLHAPEVQVEVHLANGLPSFTLVGLADTEVKEARERVRAALTQSGFAFPHNKRNSTNFNGPPLETGQITISRAARQAQFPARFQLLAAMNPCPCGWLGAFAATGQSCRCTPDVVARYQGRLSGPLLDRIDMPVEVPAISPTESLAAADGEPSATVAARVQVARERQLGRQAGATNAAQNPAQLEANCAMEPAATTFLQHAATRLGWSGRSLHRVMKLARTVADLAGTDTVAEAIQCRRALPQA